MIHSLGRTIQHKDILLFVTGTDLRPTPTPPQLNPLPPEERARGIKPKSIMKQTKLLALWKTAQDNIRT